MVCWWVGWSVCQNFILKGREEVLADSPKPTNRLTVRRRTDRRAQREVSLPIIILIKNLYRLSVVGCLVGWLVCHNFLNGRECLPSMLLSENLFSNENVSLTAPLPFYLNSKRNLKFVNVKHEITL